MHRLEVRHSWDCHQVARSLDSPPGCVRRWREWARDHPDSNSGQADVYTDSTNALANASMPPGWLQETLRHIKTHFHFVKQFIQDKSITLSHCVSEDQRADIFTKGFGAKSCAPDNNQRAHVFRKHAKTCLGMGSLTAWAPHGGERNKMKCQK